MNTSEPIKEKVITRETVNRLSRDVRDLVKHPLYENGIYYAHDEEDILKGSAMIVGPSDTPYMGGFYYFLLDYPTDYPHTPPKVTYCTNGDDIRFNPNLYKDGRVCISLLNTWKGEQWTSCQTISTILLNLCMLLNDNPLLNEPGIDKTSPDCEIYKRIIAYKNVDIAILKMMKRTTPYYSSQFDLFEEYKQKHFWKNAAFFLRDLERKSHWKPVILQQRCFTMKVYLDHEKLYKEYRDYCLNHAEEAPAELIPLLHAAAAAQAPVPTEPPPPSKKRVIKNTVVKKIDIKNTHSV